VVRHWAALLAQVVVICMTGMTRAKIRSELSRELAGRQTAVKPRPSILVAPDRNRQGTVRAQQRSPAVTQEDGMTRLLVTLVLALPGCASFAGAHKVSGDESQVVLSTADQQKAQQHCASHGKDAVSLGKGPSEGNYTYACRPRRS
jgi:hypothetical protein